MTERNKEPALCPECRASIMRRVLEQGRSPFTHRCRHNETLADVSFRGTGLVFALSADPDSKSHKGETK